MMKPSLKYAILRLGKRIPVCAALLAATVWNAAAQGQNVTFPAGPMTVRQAIAELQGQSGLRFGFKNDFDLSREVSFDQTAMPLDSALERITDPDFEYTRDGDYILISARQGMRQQAGNTPATVVHTIKGRLTDKTSGSPLGGVGIEVVGSGIAAVTNPDGTFTISNAGFGNRIVRFSLPGGAVQYKEIPADAPALDVSIDPDAIGMGDYIAVENAVPAVDVLPAGEIVPTPVTYYYDASRQEQTASGQEVVPTHSIVGNEGIYRAYQPRWAIKTNLLYWATTTPNISVEALLAPQWTIDLTFGYNAWNFSSGAGGLHHWLLEPEGRYWFCRGFEGHFIGLHGILLKFNAGNVDIPLAKRLKDHMYEGIGYGVGVSWGYHLPLGRAWGMEFNVGAGWVRFDYERYRCGDCNAYEGKSHKDYFGPTRLGISLIYMIR